jgi:hypothetical protein
MSATDALLEPLPWETRNLGIESFAVSDAFLRSPDTGTLNACLADLHQTHGTTFVQARFTTNTKTAQILEASGFYFVEATLSPFIALPKYSALERFAADPSLVLPERCKAADLEVLIVGESTPDIVAPIREIAGESFVADRFHVDHNCDPTWRTGATCCGSTICFAMTPSDFMCCSFGRRRSRSWQARRATFCWPGLVARMRIAAWVSSSGCASSKT